MKFRILLSLALIVACIAAPVHAQNAEGFESDKEVNAAIKKMVSAYKKLGEFRVTSLDTVSVFSLPVEAPALRTKAFGRIGKDGRAAIRVEKLDAQGQKTKTILVALNDGVSFYESEKGAPTVITSLAELKGEQKQRAGQRFFLASPGLRTLSLLLKSKTFALPTDGIDGGEISLENLKNGDSQIEATGASDDDERSFDFKFLLGRNGFLKKIEFRVANGGSTVFVNSLLSTPVALNGTDDFKWTNVMPIAKP